jgi:hypothetical protein
VTHYQAWKCLLSLKRLLKITPFEVSQGEYDALYDRLLQELAWKDELAEQVRVLKQELASKQDET